jgi:hypothetical protein
MLSAIMLRVVELTLMFYKMPSWQNEKTIDWPFHYFSNQFLLNLLFALELVT